jgi:chemotaxis protein methyltransferase CheR
VSDELEDLEIRLLLEAVYQHCGYDFREYARASVTRRIRRRVDEEGLLTVSGLLDRVLHEPTSMERLLADLSISVTSMFRDPTFFSAVRMTVVPLLRTYPFLRVWNAGCATGEETYSLSILLHEEGLAERTLIYATDMNSEVLQRAKSGYFRLERMREYTRQYIRAGGKASFSDYYKVADDEVRFDPRLVQNVVFAQHNLVSDGVFNQFNLIVCRNVMIYFDHNLQTRVHDLLHQSLARSGVLAMGSKESIGLSDHAASYEELDGRERLYRRLV